MPDHKEMGRQPTERERATVFAPHESPNRQPDGDPGRKVQPRIEHDSEAAVKEGGDDPGKSSTAEK